MQFTILDDCLITNLTSLHRAVSDIKSHEPTDTIFPLCGHSVNYTKDAWNWISCRFKILARCRQKTW